MKKIIYVILLGVIPFLFACENTSQTTENEDVTEEQTDCSLGMDDFRTFCGLKSGQTLDDVIELYGDPDSLQPVDKDSYWAYYFTTSAHPLIFEISAIDKKIWSIGIEALSVKNYEKDIAEIINLYKMEECKGYLLGKEKDIVEKIIGKDFSKTDEQDCFTYDYYFSDEVQVSLSFYEEQDYKCTQIVVFFMEQIPEHLFE